MIGKLKKLFSPAMLMVVVAVGVLLGGVTAYAHAAGFYPTPGSTTYYEATHTDEGGWGGYYTWSFKMGNGSVYLSSNRTRLDVGSTTFYNGTASRGGQSGFVELGIMWIYDEGSQHAVSYNTFLNDAVQGINHSASQNWSYTQFTSSNANAAVQIDLWDDYDLLGYEYNVYHTGQ